MFTVAVKRTKHVDLSKVQTSLRGPKKVKVGFPQGEADSDNIMKAIWNEFGTGPTSYVGSLEGGFDMSNVEAIGGIPERPFLRNAMRDNMNKYRNGMKVSAKKLLLGQTSLHTVLSKLGIMAQGDIQEEITALQTPPNAPSTIAQKGSSNPLIDSGEMRAAVTYKIGDF